MKEVTITSKIVGRGGNDAQVSKKASSVEMPGYLPESTWSEVWEIRTDNNGTRYIYGKMPMVLRYGVTMFKGVEIDLPSIYGGLPIDGETIYWENGKLKAKYDGGISNDISWEDIKNRPDLSTYLSKEGGTITGNLRLKADGSNFGNYLYFGDGNYCYLYEDTDDHLMIKADNGVNFKTNKPVTINGYEVLTTNSSVSGGSVSWEDIEGKPDSFVASRLEKSVKLWGREFDGTGDITGSLSNVGSITGTGSINLLGNAEFGGTLLTGGGITMRSDARLKDIQSREVIPIEELEKIEAVKYTWKNDPEKRLYYGVIAQEIKEVIPEVVYEIDELLSVDYGNAAFLMVASLVKEVKKLKDELNKLK